MECIVGEWKLSKSENFDEFMKELGVGMIMRKIGNTTKPTVKITLNDDVWTLETHTTLKTTVLKFKLNEPFDEETIDGRKVNSVVSLEDGNKLVHTQRDRDNNNVVTVLTRQLNDSGELVVVAKANEVVSTRTYSKEI